MRPQLLELFHDVTYQTSCGQLIDLITAPIGKVDLSKYTIETYMRIVTYKTAFYTFYLPAACAMHVCGVTDAAAFATAREICIRLGQFFQIQDDYLDCYGAPEVIGKIGTDIEDNKCSWLVVQAMTRCNEEERKIVEARVLSISPTHTRRLTDVRMLCGGSVDCRKTTARTIPQRWRKSRHSIRSLTWRPFSRHTRNSPTRNCAP